jgi:hypothetical protein
MSEDGMKILVLNPSPRKGAYSLVKKVEKSFVVIKTRYSPATITNYAMKHIKYPGDYSIVYNNGEEVLFRTIVSEGEGFYVPALERVRMFSFDLKQIKRV